MLRQLKALGAKRRAPLRSLPGRALLVQLCRDTAGNTLGIALATIILLVSLAGSGTDMARAYMTKTSLQNACDAGVLAGRKAMATSGTYSGPEIAKANKMFNFNFNPNATNANSITFNTSSDGLGAVNGTATTTMPTVIMGIFGFNTINLSVACSAELQMASSDVMFVLDTTGSMACEPDGSDCDSDSDSKIAGLRTAVRNFYTTVAGAVTDKTNTRIRFGFVPYSATVNIGGLVASGNMPANYLADTQPMQTALANFSTPVHIGTNGAPEDSTETYPTNITSGQCNDYRRNRWPVNLGNPVTTGTPPAPTTTTTYSTGSWTYVSGSGGSSIGTCVRRVSKVNTTYVTRARFTNWEFRNTTLDVTGFKGLGTVPVVTDIASNATVPMPGGTYDMPTLASMAGSTGVTGLTIEDANWTGCVVERSTVQQLSMSPVPSGATDLDMSSAPSDDATRWKMQIPNLQWYRGNWNSVSRTETELESNTYRMGSNCPAPAMLFTEVDTTNPAVVPTWLDNYVNALIARGNTYHDIGMIWGGRLGSTTGIFQTNVNEDATTFPSVSRHIIFMTDGEMVPNRTTYSAYGTELYDNRVAPDGTSDGTLTNYHNNRFAATCTRAKNLGYTIWVIAFGTTLSTELSTCATAGRAYFAANTTQLNNTFKFIAGQVADLRINK